MNTSEVFSSTDGFLCSLRIVAKDRRHMGHVSSREKDPGDNVGRLSMTSRSRSCIAAMKVGV